MGSGEAAWRRDLWMGRMLRLRTGVRRWAQRVGIDRYRRDPFAAQRLFLGADFDGVVLDAGANVGQSARRYRRCFPQARIHSFEPHPRSFEALRRWADGRPGVITHNLALSDAAGRDRLHAYASSRAASFLRLSDRAGTYFPYLRGKEEPLEVLEVATATVEGFCAEAEIDRVGVLKLDVQGSELRVLRGASALLDRAAVDLIYAELIFGELYEGQEGAHQIAGFLAERGYRMAGLYDLNYGANRLLLMAEALFASPRVLPS